MQIYGQYIAWKTRQLGTTSVEVEIWDWKAGARIWVGLLYVDYTFPTDGSECVNRNTPSENTSRIYFLTIHTCLSPPTFKRSSRCIISMHHILSPIPK